MSLPGFRMCDVQMWLAMHISSLTPSKKYRKQVFGTEKKNRSSKYYCALLVSLEVYNITLAG